MQPTRPAPRDPVIAIGRAFAIGATLLCLLPIPLLLAVATSETWQQGLWAGGVTFRWLTASWTTVAPFAAYSLRLAFTTLLLNVLIGLPAAYALARRRFPGRQVVRALIGLPLAVPGIALALALILAYPTWRGDGWLLIAGHVLYTLPFFIGALVPALASPDLREREAVAATLGADPLRRMIFVTLPGIRAALLAAAIIVVTLSLGEFNVSFFLFVPTAKTLPIDLYAAYITGRLEIAAAATVWFILMVIPAAAVIEYLGGARIGQA